MDRFITYDLETFLNCFLFISKFSDSPEIQVFEISSRKSDRDALLTWLNYLKNCKVIMVGFNNIGFDYNIIHELLNNPYTFDALKAYLEAQKIFATQHRGLNAVRFNDRILPQLDLVKLHHFDNVAKATSLKALQFAMRSESVDDLPYDPAVPLTSEQMDELIVYGRHDVTETEKFALKSMKAINIRLDLLNQGVLTGDVLNFSDVKLGTEYLVKKIGRSKCYEGSKPKNTFRTEVPLKSVILPKIKFKTERFQDVLDWFNKQTIYTTGDSPKPSLEVSLAGIDFNFGIGGVHASVENRYFASNEEFVIRDIDVSGMYVAVAIANGFAPEHLGQDFSTAYRQLQADRKNYSKKTVMNLILKLAGNGVFGNSNNPYSPFYDPKYTFSVTVNGQLQLLQLAEVLSLIPGVTIIQANTDGITAYLPRSIGYLFDLWKDDWERDTGLKLEEVEYSKMWIRDVNNYLAIDTKGEVKRKGAYWYPINEDDYHGGSGSNWNKDFSNISAQKGIEQVLLNGWKSSDIIRLMSDPFDFMLRYKTPHGAQVFIGDRPVSKTLRYYVSTAGEPARKVSKPKGQIGAYKRRNGLSDSAYLKIASTLPAGTWDERVHTKNKSKYEQVVTSIESGWKIKCCNKASDFNWADVDYDYYTNEIDKLVIGAKNV